MPTSLQRAMLFLLWIVTGPGAFGSALESAGRPALHGDLLLLDSLLFQNGAGETISVTRLSYLLSGFALEREEGGWVESPGQYAWMDAAQRRLEVRLNGVPEGKYRALRFHVGLDPDANAMEPAKLAADSPLNPNL